MVPQELLAALEVSSGALGGGRRGLCGRSVHDVAGLTGKIVGDYLAEHGNQGRRVDRLDFANRHGPSGQVPWSLVMTPEGSSTIPPS